MYIIVIHIEKRWQLKSKKRLAVDLPVSLHECIAHSSKEKGLTITSWMNMAILEKLIRDGDVEVVNQSPLEDHEYFRG
jgi:hypothetical protein